MLGAPFGWHIRNLNLNLASGGIKVVQVVRLESCILTCIFTYEHMVSFILIVPRLFAYNLPMETITWVYAHAHAHIHIQCREGTDDKSCACLKS